MRKEECLFYTKKFIKDKKSASSVNDTPIVPIVCDVGNC